VKGGQMFMKNEKAKSISEDKKLDEMELQSMLEAYGNDILRLCTLYLKDRHLAEDALQETFIKVWQKYHTYLGQANEKTWIMRIAINVCKNYLRTAWIKRNSVVQIEDIVKASQCQYRHIEESVDLLNAILTLKEKYRVVLLLYYYQEFTVKEIAEILDKKQSTVLSLMKRGREQLKQKLQTNYMEGERYEF
jgi:RNA polymerase sigma-70 factor (ECF subfamily)